jgi:hypothetical protein
MFFRGLPTGQENGRTVRDGVVRQWLCVHGRVLTDMHLPVTMKCRKRPPSCPQSRSGRYQSTVSSDPPKRAGRDL